MLSSWILAAGCVMAALSFVATGAVRSWIVRRGILDHPNGRSSHTVPTPVGGGVVIVGLGAVGALLLTASAGASVRLLAILLAPGLGVALVSLGDDVRGIAPAVRLLVHSVAAMVILIGAGLPSALILPFAGAVSLGPLVPALLAVWVVGLTNAYNFMDGIDGIAAGQAVVAGAGWAAAGAMLELPWVSIAGVCVAAASLGFLVHNWSPATIFMGDVGSAFLGFVLAGLPVLALAFDPRAAVLGAAFVFPFVFDTGYTLLRRIIRRERVFEAHRSHLYQRLVIGGISHAGAATLYTLLASFTSIAALAWLRRVPFADAALLATVVTVAGVQVASARAAERQRMALRGRP